MNVHTHWLGGALAGAALAHCAAHLPAAPLVAAAVLAAPLPDLDHPGSAYGRWLPLPGVARIRGHLEPFRPGPFGNAAAAGGQVGRVTPFGILWHRGPLHSLAAAGGFAVVAASVARSLVPANALAIGWGVFAGCLSHLALDALNTMGQALFWPLSRTRWRLPWPRWPVGSAGETLIGAALLGGLLLWGRDVTNVLAARGGW
ncbi:MAG: metal-dependent hydrolase [Actinomycetia bacterium]|nr:metal-dependent hydrolase [Actinomycetes bacterium]